MEPSISVAFTVELERELARFDAVLCCGHRGHFGLICNWMNLEPTNLPCWTNTSLLRSADTLDNTARQQDQGKISYPMPSEDFTRAITVKRATKKKSGYVVVENEGEFLVGDVPDKARVNVGDRIVGINGVRAEHIEDEEEANDLVNRIRLVVVPVSEIEEYEAAKAAEEPVADVAPTNGKRVSVPDVGQMAVLFRGPALN